MWCNLTDQHLPPLLQKLRTKILKREYVDFTDLLSSNMYPVHTSSSSDNFTLAINPEDTSTLSFVSSQQKKSRINGLSSWLEAWNLYFRTLLSGFPHLAPDLLAYHDQICKFSRKFKSSAWLMYDTAFCHMAASNLSTSWSTINEQLYNDILKEETRSALHATPTAIALSPVLHVLNHPSPFVPQQEDSSQAPPPP